MATLHVQALDAAHRQNALLAREAQELQRVMRAAGKERVSKQDYSTVRCEAVAYV